MKLTVSPGFRYMESNHHILPVRLFDIGETILQPGEKVVSGGAEKAFVEFSWCTGGSGEVVLYDRPFLMRQNDVFYYLPCEDHHLHGLSGQWSLRWVCFDGPLAAAIMDSYRYPRLQRATMSCPVELFNEISAEIGSENPINRGILVGKLMMILAMANGSVETRRHPHPVIDRVLRFIEARLTDPGLSVVQIADQLGIPRSTLLKTFAAEMKAPLGRYIRALRYNRALELLRNSELSVSEVAARCGYGELPSFSRLIRRGTGMSPLECRRNRSQPLPVAREEGGQ